MQRLVLAVAFSAILRISFVGSPALALLIDAGRGLVGDTDFNITWLQDANYAMTSGFDADGLLTWDQANSFIAAMNSGTIENVGFTDWRLPTALNADGSGPCSDFGCTESELGHLFHGEFGAAPRGSYLTGSPEVIGLFRNLPNHCQPDSLCAKDFIYWTSTVIVRPSDVDLAWQFSFFNGSQGTSPQNNTFRVLPVRDGAIIPEPTTALLLAFGLAGLAVRRREDGVERPVR